MKIIRSDNGTEWQPVGSLTSGETFFLHSLLDTEVYMKTDMLCEGRFVCVNLAKGQARSFKDTDCVLPIDASVLVD